MESGVGEEFGRRLRWGLALTICAAIAISYLDRQTLPWAIKAIQVDIPITNQLKAALDSAFLVAYGLMYLGGGWLLDRVGTRRGFAVIMSGWSLACASQGLATGLSALAVSRLLLGAGEGGSFPAATRAVVEAFPVRDRALAMGLINGGTAVGAVVAAPLIALILLHVHWLGLSSWRWVFFLTGLLGVIWTVGWLLRKGWPEAAQPQDSIKGETPPTTADLLAQRSVRALVTAKFLTDGAWYFYLFWLPKYLFEAQHFDLQKAAALGWIPYAASGVGCLVGGWFSGFWLRRGRSVNFSRKMALGFSAACMPWVILAPSAPSVAIVLALFSLAFFGQQSWSTLIMTLPGDLAPVSALGRLAGLVGMGGAFGGIAMGQAAGWMLDHGLGYTPVLAVAGSLHLIAFALICIAIPVIQPLTFLRKGSP
jgi:ACS family hexuronate transporter-like MFS transporter